MGIGGPPLVEAATGLKLTPAEIGAMSLHERTGAVDLLVDDESEVLAALRRWLRLINPAPVVSGYEPGPVPALRDAVPTNPRQAYDVRGVISLVADAGSPLELRERFAANVVTMFVEVGGCRAGVIANQPRVLAGAIDSPGSDKMARFIKLCNALDIPIVFMVDTPGFMVGPAAEETGLVRHSARVIQALATVEVPIITVVLRKAYGLAYYAMGSPPFGPAHCMAWPTAEFGGMGLVGAANIVERGRPVIDDRRRDEHAALLRDNHSVSRVARRYAIDEVIDPADTRDALHRVLVRQRPPLVRGKRHLVDAW
jgi:acetyl-CoA carboxylase carboxyltransferase component